MANSAQRREWEIEMRRRLATGDLGLVQETLDELLDSKSRRRWMEGEILRMARPALLLPALQNPAWSKSNGKVASPFSKRLAARAAQGDSAVFREVISLYPPSTGEVKLFWQELLLQLPSPATVQSVGDILAPRYPEIPAGYWREAIGLQHPLSIWRRVVHSNLGGLGRAVEVFGPGDLEVQKKALICEVTSAHGSPSADGVSALVNSRPYIQWGDLFSPEASPALVSASFARKQWDVAGVLSAYLTQHAPELLPDQVATGVRQVLRHRVTVPELDRLEANLPPGLGLKELSATGCLLYSYFSCTNPSVPVNRTVVDRLIAYMDPAALDEGQNALHAIARLLASVHYSAELMDIWLELEALGVSPELENSRGQSPLGLVHAGPHVDKFMQARSKAQLAHLESGVDGSGASRLRM